MKWLKNGFELSFRIRPAGLALAALYAVVCWATWHLSVDQFFLPAGIRVAALLLTPKRMWAYLILGEYAYFAQMRYPMIEDYGMAWVILGSACLIPAVALIVHLHDKLMAFTTESWLLSLAASAALVATALKLGLIHMLWPVPPSMPFYTNAMLYVLSDYIAILTIAPLALLWLRRRSHYDWTTWRRRPTLAALVSLGVLGALLIQLGTQDHSARATLQLLLVLPVIALTCMHGWRGAAVGVPLMNIILSQTMPTTGLPGSFDETTFFTQQIIAITSTALIALGPRITHHYHQHAPAPMAASRARAFSRSAHLANEQDLRERALGLRQIADDIEEALGETVQQLKADGHDVPATDLLRAFSRRSRRFRELTSMVYPTELEHAGLYVALHASGLSETWNASHRMARPLLGGDPCQLSMGLQLAAYRTFAEAVSLLLKEETGQIQISARCGRYKGTRGIVLNVALLDRHRTLAPRTMERAIDRLSARAHAYSGSVQCRGHRITMVLLDSAGEAGRETAPNARNDICAAPARN
ncbi:TPA: MASE1 domain-containing protein [Stenotrophomonas maltophilia]|nr:MASE1 domain-containing protein [Stenotrophomonas maltophilia]